MGISASALGDKLGDQLGDELGDVFGALVTPITIRGVDNIAYWGNMDSFVPGSGSEIITLTDLTANGRAPTQGVALDRPVVLDIGGFDYADFVASEWLEFSGGANYIAAGAASLTIWMTGRVDLFTGTRFLYELSNGASGSGMDITTLTGGNLRVRVNTSTGSKSNTISFSDTAVHVFELRWADSLLSLYVDGVLTGSALAAAGTLANNLPMLTLGKQAGSPKYHNGAIGEFVVDIGTPAATADERAAMLALLTSRI